MSRHIEPGSSGGLGMVEISDRSGAVKQRICAHAGRWGIGRAYDNEIIVGDAYVCAHHLELRLNEDSLQVRDLGSVNGSWVSGRRLGPEWLDLKPGDRVQFGHSQLRFHLPTEPVAPARRDALVHGLLGFLARPPALVLGLLMASAAVLVGRYLEEPREMGIGLMLSQLVNPAFALFLWAGLWSLINRLTAYRANFTAHLSIAAWALMGNFLAEQLVPLLVFAIGARSSGSLAVLVVQIMVVAAALHAHLTFVTHKRNLLQTGLATGLAALLMGSPAMSDWLRSDEFSSLPRLDPLLEPPATRWVQGQPVDGFLQRAERLRERVNPEAD